MTLLTAAFLFFAAAALGGFVLARAHVRHVPPPRVVVVVHPLLAASGLILLGGSYVRAGDASGWIGPALVVLTVAAAGGICLAVWRQKRGSLPVVLIVGHALIALTGAGLVLYEILEGKASVPQPF